MDDSTRYVRVQVSQDSSRRRSLPSQEPSIYFRHSGPCLGALSRYASLSSHPTGLWIISNTFLSLSLFDGRKQFSVSLGVGTASVRRTYIYGKVTDAGKSSAVEENILQCSTCS